MDKQKKIPTPKIRDGEKQNKNNNQVLILTKHIVNRFQKGGHSVTQS